MNKLTAPKLNKTVEKQDGGILHFTGWGISVRANTVKEAKKIIKESFGVDVDKDTPPPQPNSEN